MKRTECSHETVARIEQQLPPEVVEALNKHGWNALGVYDLVKRELAAERRTKRATQLSKKEHA